MNASEHLPVQVSEAYKHLARAAELVTLPDTDNVYLQDAAHFARQCNEQSEFGPVSDEHRSMQSHVLSMLGQFAAETGNESLAEHVFASQPLAEKWQLYAHAREHAALAPTTLANWQLELDSDEARSAAQDDPYTNAVVAVAQARVVLAEYKLTPDPKDRKELRRQIRGHTARFKKAVRHQSVSPDVEQQLANEIHLASARAGAWQHVEDAPFTELNDRGMAQLVIKGLAGELTLFDRRKYLPANTPAKRVTLWLAAHQKNPETPNLDMSLYQSEFTGKALIEAVAPAVANALGFTARSYTTQLRRHLQNGDFEDANTTYEHITNTHPNNLKLRAALTAAPYAIDMAATEPAYDIYGTGLRQSIEAIAALIGEETDRTIIIEQLQELRNELQTIKDPAERIRCEGAFIAAELQLTPDVRDARMDIRQMSLERTWTALEQTASQPELLARLRDDLAANGITLAPALKPQASGQYYIGFIPVITAAMNRPAKADRTWDLDPDPKEHAALRQTAATLNTLLGEERYVVDDSSTPAQMRGSWNTTLIFKTREFYQAHDRVASGKPFLVDEVLSSKIRTALSPHATT